MKLHLPKALRTALVATFATVLSLGSAADAATYSNLTEVSIDADNHVYYDGKGTFYVQSAQDTTLDVTLDLNQFVSYQGSNDYTGFTPFVGWTFANGITDGIADVSTKNNAANYSGLTGYYGSNKYALSGNGQSTLTLATLQSYATNNMVTVTVRNNITSGVSLTLGSGDNAVTYQNTGLKFSNQNTSTTSYSVNLNYVTSVKLNTASTLDTDSFELPPDYSQPFHSDRWDAGDKTSLGRVLFVGDSITHGVGDQTWRWQLFKTMVDNGIENEIAGPRSDYDTRFANTTSDRGMASYGGVDFANVHLAQSSGRTHNIITGSANISGVNYGGWSTSKTAAAYDADTMICLMGTNDILSDGGAYVTKFAKLLGGTVSYDEATKHYTWEHNDTSSWGEWGTMGSIMGDLMKQEGDTMYVMSIPTWGIRNDLKYGPNGNVDIETAHHGVQEYNGMLKQWTEQYSTATGKKVQYVEVNRGLVDLTDSVSFKGYTKFFREGGDQLHPTEQGSLIIAGNLAQGMGLAGRTAGLVRSQVGHEEHGWLSAAQNIALSDGQTQQALSNVFDLENGYTIDFNATFGDGSANGWKGLDSALSIAIGDGTNGGTLKLSEGYISWGDTVLFCQDNHLTTNDTLRVAYNHGNAEQNIGSGYYVWLGDMLIGQALNAGSSTLNGVTLTSTGGNAVVKGLSYANTAYAPSTTLTTAVDNGLSHITPPSQPEEILTPMPSGDRDVVVAPTTFEGLTSTQLAAKGGVYTGAVTGTKTDDANVLVVSNQTPTANLFGGLNAIMQKANAEEGTTSLSMVIGNDVTVGGQSYSSLNVAFAGSYNSTISGKLAVEINNATMNGNILMGVIANKDRGSIGSAELTVNRGATINGNIFGGSQVSGGTISGDSVITINGGHITGNVEGGGNVAGSVIEGNAAIAINGGVISGNVTIGGGTIEGNSTVTVTGNKASIGGNIIVAGEKGKVVLKDVAASGHSDGFDQYKGTITASNLELNNYTAEEVKANLVGEHLVAKGETATTVSNLTLTACDITVEGGATLILSGTQTYGHTATYSGALTIAEGTTFTVTNPTEGTRPGTYTSGDNGFAYSGHIYDVLTPENPAVDHLLGTDGNTLGLVTNLTLKGGEGMENYFFVYKNDTGILSAYENIVTSTCYITKGSLTYGKQTGAYGATQSLQLSNGATLVMADNLAEGVTINSANGNVELLENVTLSKASFAADSTATLKGTGTFALDTITAANQVAMPAGVSLDSAEWKGSVLVTTGGNVVTDITAASLNALAPNADAWVELQKVKGYFSSGNQTISANLRLVGEEALFMSNGYGSTYTFTGDIAGDGTFVHAFDKVNYKFQGDISQWFGELSTAKTSTWNRVTAVTLEGKATTINAALTSNLGSNLDLTLGNITNGAAGYTFNNIVKVHDLSAAGKTIILGAADDVVPGGHLTVGGAATVGKLIAAEGTTATFNGISVQLSNDKDYWSTTVDAAKATLSFADRANVRVSGTLNIGTLHADGSVSIADNHNVNFVPSATIHNLSSSAGAHLTLAAVFDTSNNTTYTLGGANTMASANDFNGTIEFKRNNSKTDYVTQLILADTNIAKDAVIELNNANAGSKFGIGIAASTVKVQGIQDVEGSKGGLIFSGSNYNNPDSTIRTLEIMGSGTYTTSASVGANINILVTGTGTQTFTGDMSAFNGTFTTRQPGLVQMASGSANMGIINMQNNSATEAATLQFSAKEGAANEYTFSTWTMSGQGDTGKKWMVVDEGVTVRGTESNIGVGSVATINNGWGIAGGGLEVNGKLITAGVISMDGPSSSTLKGTGTIQTTGLNVSNGNTVNVEGGVRIEVTSDKGIYKRDGGDSTLNLADATLAAKSTDWELKNNINYVNLTSADKGTTFDAAADRTITISKAMGGAGALVKTGEGKLSLNAANSFSGGVTVKEGTLEMKNASALGSGSLTMEGGTLEVAQGVKASATAAADKDFKGSISVGANGALDVLHLSDTATAGLVNLNLDTNAVFGVYTSVLASEENVAALSVSGTLTASAGSTLNADLVMQSGSTLHLAEGAALTMGCSVTLENGTKLELGGNPLDGPVSLYNDVESLTLGDTTYTYEQMGWYDAAGIITSLNGEALSGDYVIGYWNGTVSFAEKSVPEPATATLSLLALAALAARRRRH